MTIVAILAVLLIAPTYLNRLRKYPTLFTLVVMLMFSTIVLLELNYANAENRVRVAVIDTGIDSELATPYLCKDGNKDFTGKGMKDVSGHGTNIAGIIAKKINNKIWITSIFLDNLIQLINLEKLLKLLYLSIILVVMLLW